MELIVISPDVHLAAVPQASRRASRSTAIGLLDSPSNRRVQSRHACRLGADVFARETPCLIAVCLATSAPATATWKRRSRFLPVLPPASAFESSSLKTAEQREQVEQLVACQVSEEDIRV